MPKTGSVPAFVTLCLLFALAVQGPPLTAQPASQAVPPGVQLVIDGYDLAPDSFTLLVQNTDGSAPLLALNTEQAFNPASTIKTLTTLAGLEQLGAGYTWNTHVYTRGDINDGVLHGDLIIQGGGDPFLVEEHLRSMLKTLQRRGIHTIVGDLVLESSLFDPSVSRDDVIDGQPDRAYNVLPHALLSNFQVVTFYFRPHSNGRDVVITADPPLPNLRIVNQLRQENRACSGFQRGVAFTADRSASAVTFSGTFPSRCEEYALARAALDAPQYLYGLFAVLWQELGGEHHGSWRSGDVPRDAALVLSWQSPPLSDIIRSINKYSNNVMTRHLLLTLGLEHSGPPATLDKGVAAIRDYLDGVGIAHDDLVMVNGAGLSRDVRLTASLLGAALRRGWQIPTMPEFAASLPLAGTDGTMRSRLSGPDTSATMHIKTGSLSGVNGVAGYVHGKSGNTYVVISLLNHPQADAGYGQELGDALLRWAREQ